MALAPIAWAIYHGETQTGVTIIRMSIYLDAGEILAQEVIDIGPEETAGDVETRLGPLGGHMAVQVIDQIIAGTTHGIKQDKSQVTKAPKLTKEHGLIDWTRPAAAVCNQIRAMQPWPSAYTFLHREGKPPVRLMVTKASSSVAFPVANCPPGSLLFAAQLLLVKTGDEFSVGIAELQPAGKKRMSAVEFLRGHPLQPGDRLGAESS